MYLACTAAEGGVARKLQEKFSCIKYPGGRRRTGLGQKRENLLLLIEVSPGVKQQPIIKHSCRHVRKDRMLLWFCGFNYFCDNISYIYQVTDF